MTNPFERLAAEQIANPVKSRMKAAETRRARSVEAEKKLAEDDKLLSLYRAARRKQFEALLAGPHGREIRGLISFMRTMTLSSAPALIAFMRKAAWVQALSEDERFVLLGLVSHGIARTREKAGLPPFDDGLPGEPLKAFHQIKEIVGVR